MRHKISYESIELNIVGLNKPDIKRFRYTNSVSLPNSVNSLVCKASTLAYDTVLLILLK